MILYIFLKKKFLFFFQIQSGKPIVPGLGNYQFCCCRTIFFLYFYQKENNAARYETVEQASALDDRLIRCWEKHPNLKVIPNSLDFDKKMNILLDEISNFLEDK